MQAEFHAKFLRQSHLSQGSEGFTLIELLVVIIIIGILSAIALPSFLNQANKARESEAKQYLGSMNRAQQARFLEKSAFSNDFAILGLGIASNTTHYLYSIGAPTGVNAVGTYNVATEPVTGATMVAAGTEAYLTKTVINGGSPKNTDTLRAYLGLVDLATEEAGTLGGGTTAAVLCQKRTPGAISSSFANFNGIRNPEYPTCNSSVSEPLE